MIEQSTPPHPPTPSPSTATAKKKNSPNSSPASWTSWAPTASHRCASWPRATRTCRRRRARRRMTRRMISRIWSRGRTLRVRLSKFSLLFKKVQLKERQGRVKYELIHLIDWLSCDDLKWKKERSLSVWCFYDWEENSWGMIWYGTMDDSRRTPAFIAIILSL